MFIRITLAVYHRVCQRTLSTIMWHLFLSTMSWHLSIIHYQLSIFYIKNPAIHIKTPVANCYINNMNTQNKVTIARWGNNAKSAYSIDIDDYPWVNLDKHDELLTSRGLKATMAVIVGKFKEKDWDRINQIAENGHEICNHTWDHSSATEKYGFPGWDDEARRKNVTIANEEIEKQTGIKPTYYVFPFDEYTEVDLAFLEQEGFLGAAGGDWWNKNFLNPYDIKDTIRSNYLVLEPGEGLEAFIDYAQQVIDCGGWGTRMMHGLDDGDEYSTSSDDFAKHLDWVIEKQDKGEIWTETCSNVIRYIKERENCSAEILSENGGPIELAVNTNGMDTNTFDYPLTLLLETPMNVNEITQDGEKIPFERSNGTCQFNASPAKGNILVR